MLLKLSWRSLWRNKRRTLITVAAVTFAVMLCVAMRGIQRGTYALNIKTTLQLFTGYLQIQHPEYQLNQSLHKSFKSSPDLEETLSAHSNVAGHTPRLIGNGLVSFRDNSVGAGLIGIDPDQEPHVSNLFDKVRAGRMITAGQPEVVLGAKLLQNLKAEIGDEIVVLAQGFDGSLGNLKFTIVGTFKSGIASFDRGMLLMNLTDLQDLLAMYGRITSVAIVLNDLNAIPLVESELNEQLEEANIKALSWDELLPELYQAIELDNVSGIIFLFILVTIVAFGITNTVLMSVTERFREFGVLLAVGMPQRKLVIQVFWETVIIALIGILVGNLIGFGINYYLTENPIIMGGEFATMYEEYGFLPMLVSSTDLSIFVTISVMVLAITIVAAMYPLLKVWRLQPLKGIRYT